MRALVVDDSKTMRMIIGRIMKSMGYDVVEAANGMEARSRLNDSGPIDVALVDWNMPGMNGYEFICSVRSNGENDAVVLMMVTSQADQSYVVRALDAGANEYIMKPFTRELIAGKLGLLGLPTGIES